ncbi:hypothetical protein LOTGIDRAFT_138598 [Lottia gigantea]|uniref:Diphthine--ammonia ligase n=1 Tax=Lottia gigantea TaxID=225164 RepID=V4AE63_LOTGI|nr:hypothetical protein LOTGIDRAFT_138598 [Lottia gigantea]ESP02314.1 hypothetical protein LOTGIDRAFT_138598 [Lottia gigantea]
MKLFSSFITSGGKDSCYNMMQCVAEGHEIVALANLKPKECDELDSYMYQTVGHHAIDIYAEAMSLPLYRRTITGESKLLDKYYTPTEGDEVEDLYELLKDIESKEKIEGVSVGAILSDYQRVRVENVCERLGLTSLCYLWRRDQDELLSEMIQCQVEAVIIKVATLGMIYPDKHLGKTISEIYPLMVKLNSQYGVNICGEGGEFETFTCDCPLFNKKIVIDDVQRVMHTVDPFSPVGYLNLQKLHLEDKMNKKNKIQIRTAFMFFRDTNIYSILKTLKNENDERLYVKDRLKDLPLKKWCDLDEFKNGKEMEVTSISDINTSLGVTTKDIVSVRLYVQNMADFPRINSVYKQLFGINPPVRVCCSVCLPSNVSLQLECFGYTGTDILTLHVQSLSHWAAANIGPYSQAKMVDEMIFISGQIGLCPVTLSIIDGGIKIQASLALQHTSRILSVMAPGCNLNNVLLCICYVTNPVYIQHVKLQWRIIRSNPVTLFQCVVVPELPKKALVEWQVYASKPSAHLLGQYHF